MFFRFIMSKLESLADRMQKAFKGKIIVPGKGPFDSNVVIIGQNPGEQEEKSGMPFVGRSGKFLTKTLEKNGIDRNLIYITNLVKFRTKNNAEPTQDYIDKSMPFLLEELRAINPKIVVLLGKMSWNVPEIEGAEYFRVYHPSAAMRFNKMRERFESDFEKLGKKIRKLLKD